MFDHRIEPPIKLAEAAGTLPGRRPGKHIHPSAIHRWTTSGLRGVKLESLKIGGVTHTSRAALQRFFERLSSDMVTDGASPSAADVDAELDDLGV